MFEHKDSTAQESELNILEEAAFQSFSIEFRTEKGKVTPDIGEEDPESVREKVYDLGDSIYKRFVVLEYYGSLDEISVFIEKLSNPRVKTLLYQDVLTSEDNLYLKKEEGVDSYERFIDSALNSLYPSNKAVFQCINFCKEVLDVSKKRDRGKGEMNEYFRYENKKTLESLSLMIDKFILGDSPIPSYVGFSRKNVNKKSLKRILGDLSRRDFTGEEIVAIESVIVMNDTSILEAKVLGQMGVEDTSNPSNVIKYAEFLLEAEEGVVDIKKSIFYNLSCCNEKKDRESVKKLLKIINGPEPIESCEYINLYVVNGFDGEKLGGKIIAYLTSKIKDRKDITKKEYDHLWKQIFFQGDRDRNKYNRKERIISKEDCVKISMLLNDKKEIIIKEPE